MSHTFNSQLMHCVFSTKDFKSEFLAFLKNIISNSMKSIFSIDQAKYFPVTKLVPFCV